MPKERKQRKIKLLAYLALYVVDRYTAETIQAHALYAGDAAMVKTHSLTTNRH